MHSRTRKKTGWGWGERRYCYVVVGGRHGKVEDTCIGTGASTFSAKGYLGGIFS